MTEETTNNPLHFTSPKNTRNKLASIYATNGQDCTKEQVDNLIIYHSAIRKSLNQTFVVAAVAPKMQQKESIASQSVIGGANILGATPIIGPLVRAIIVVFAGAVEAFRQFFNKANYENFYTRFPNGEAEECASFAKTLATTIIDQKHGEIMNLSEEDLDNLIKKDTSSIINNMSTGKVRLPDHSQMIQDLSQLVAPKSLSDNSHQEDKTEVNENNSSEVAAHEEVKNLINENKLSDIITPNSSEYNSNEEVENIMTENPMHEHFVQGPFTGDLVKKEQLKNLNSSSEKESTSSQNNKHTNQGLWSAARIKEENAAISSSSSHLAG